MNISLKRYLTILNFILIGGIVYFSVNAFYGIMAIRLNPDQPDLTLIQRQKVRKTRPHQVARKSCQDEISKVFIA